MRRATLICALLGASLVAASPAPPPSPGPPRLLRTLAHVPSGYDPQRRDVVTDLLLGDMLFHSPHILGPTAQRLGLSCNSCHPNGSTEPRFVVPGEPATHPGSVDVTTRLFRSEADDGLDNPLNIPSLRGVRFTSPYGHDGRTASLFEFTQSVVVGEFGGAPLPWSQLSALVHYIQDLDLLPNAKLDPQGRVTALAGPSARRGEALFREPREGFGGGSCATCHVPSSFFRDGRVHRIGSGGPGAPHSFEDGFETPTLLGTRETAPYFHDGRFAALADVIAWFDATFRLRLTRGQRADLTAYVEAVGSVDTLHDTRPLAQRMEATFVYLELLAEGSVRDDRRAWSSVIAMCTEVLEGAPRHRELDERRAIDRARLDRLGAAARAPVSLEASRDEAKALHRELTRYAADLMGALATP